MHEVSLYWTMIVALVSAGWVVIGFIRDRITQSVERTGAMVERLLEIDKIIIDNPDIQRYLSKTGAAEEQFFRKEAILDEDIFFKAKSLVYSQLNIFDELLSISSRTTGGWWSFVKLPALVETEDWEAYIKMRLGHPLFRSILKNEAYIFGASLRGFGEKHRAQIESSPVDPFIW